MEAISDHWRHCRQWGAWVAVTGSLLLHAIGWFHFPPLPVGRTAQWEAAPRSHPIVLHEVRPGVADAGRRVRPVDSGAAGAMAFDDDAFAAIWETFAPAAPAVLELQLAGEERALAAPEIPERELLWDSRQEILAIRERLVPDERAVLPRHLMPAAERIPRAPDITAPAYPVDVARTSTGAPGEVGAPRTRRLGADDQGAADSRRWETVEVLPDDEMERDAEAVENLLQLTVYTYTPPGVPDYRYFRLGIQRAPGASLPPLGKDVLLIQDASASMTQRTVERTRTGWHYWLGSLRPEDRFDVWAFNDDVSRAFGGLTGVDARNRARAAYFVENLSAEGETDVYASLLPLLDYRPDSARPLLAILVSDGIPTAGMLDSTAIIEEFTQANAGRVTVFTVGGGPRINDYLLDLIAYMNRGDSIITTQRNQLPASMERLARELSRPVLLDLNYRWVQQDDVESYPQLLTHLYLDRPLVLYGRVPSDQAEAMIHVLGRAADGLKDMVFPVDFTGATAGEADIRQSWAWQKIYHLISEHIRTGDPALLDEIEQWASTHELHNLFGTEFLSRELQQRFRFHGQRRDLR